MDIIIDLKSLALNVRLDFCLFQINPKEKWKTERALHKRLKSCKSAKYIKLHLTVNLFLIGADCLISIKVIKDFPRPNIKYYYFVIKNILPFDPPCCVKYMNMKVTCMIKVHWSLFCWFLTMPYTFLKKNAQFHERSFHVKITHQHVEFAFKMIFHPLSNDVDLSLPQKMNKRFERLLFSEIVLFCISTWTLWSK